MNERRHFYRHPVTYPVEVIEEPSHRIRRTSAVDYSEGGLCVYLNKEFERGSEVCLHIPVQERIFKIYGQIAWTEKQPEKDLYKTGVTFKNATSGFVAKMAEELISIEQYREALSRESGREVSLHDASEAWVKEHARQFAELFDVFDHPVGDG